MKTALKEWMDLLVEKEAEGRKEGFLEDNKKILSKNVKKQMESIK